MDRLKLRLRRERLITCRTLTLGLCAVLSGSGFITKRRVLQEKSLTNLELRLKRKEGGECGEPYVIEGTVIDITERKRAEEALKQREQSFRALFQGAAQGILESAGGRR